MGAALVASLLAGGRAGAQVVRGTVTDSVSGLPVPDAVVALRAGGVRTSDSTRTDAAGRFELRASGAGPFRVVARRVGFAPDSAEVPGAAGAGDAAVTIRLTRVAVALDSVAVVERRRPDARNVLGMAGFAWRRGREFGRYLTREELVARDAYQVLDAFFGGVGTLVLGSERGDPVIRSQVRRNRRCAPGVVIDGRVVAPDVAMLVLSTLPVARVDAIEVYDGRGRIPSEFNQLFALPPCALIVVHRAGAR